MSNKGTSYDAIPYPTVPFPESHPERLCAVAKLFGLDAPRRPMPGFSNWAARWGAT